MRSGAVIALLLQRSNERLKRHFYASNAAKGADFARAPRLLVCLTVPLANSRVVKRFCEFALRFAIARLRHRVLIRASASNSVTSAARAVLAAT